MKKVFYFMHIPWGWAKQRPHFIAEYLAEHFEVCVYFEKQYMGKKRLLNKTDNPRGVTLNELFKLPLPDHKYFRTINSILIKSQINKVIDNYDIIWLTYPYLFGEIKTIIPQRCKVIYDCMDNALEFPLVRSSPDLRIKILNNEKELLERSNIIFASSDHLKKTMLQRYGMKKEIFVVNNAIDLENRDIEFKRLNPSVLFKIKSIYKRKGINLTYIGTISEWIDTDLILESLERFRNINYIFWGPFEIKLPDHENIFHAGPIEHKYIFDIMDKSDALIMPFKINELVRSINPIKLYEYIYSYKPSIVAEYDETLKFENFVHLYRNENDYLALLKKLTENNLFPKRSLKDHKIFAQDNTWDKRIKLIVDKLIQQ